MKQLIFGTVNIEMENKNSSYKMSLRDDGGNLVEFDGLDTQTATLLNTTVRNLNTLARNCEIATILAFEDEGIDVIPDLMEDSKNDKWV